MASIGTTPRPDRDGVHRSAFEHNRKRILATQEVCAICGQPVDKALRFPHPMSATVDHIIPIDKGGHPSDIDNLQLAHFCCNRKKGDKLTAPQTGGKPGEPRAGGAMSNRLLPQSRDWKTYRSD